MDKSINKRLSELGVTDKELTKIEKKVNSIIGDMTPLKILHTLKEKYIERIDEHPKELRNERYEDDNIFFNKESAKALNQGVIVVNECIDLISCSKERKHMLRDIDYLLSFVKTLFGLDELVSPGLSLTADEKVKKCVNDMENTWRKKIKEELDI